jgi:hypothetical protein
LVVGVLFIATPHTAPRQMSADDDDARQSWLRALQSTLASLP